MASRNKAKKFKKKQPLSSKIAIGLMLAMAIGAAAKFTPVLSLFGISRDDHPTGSMALGVKRKNFDLETLRERQNAEAAVAAKQEAIRKILEEADRQRAHQEDLLRNTAQEAAFKAWYKPAKECMNKSGRWDLTVKCANDYIAAQKYFMEHHPK